MFPSWWLGNDPTAETEASIGTFPSLTSGDQRNTRRLPVWLFGVHVDMCEHVLDLGSERPAGTVRVL